MSFLPARLDACRVEKITIAIKQFVTNYAIVNIIIEGVTVSVIGISFDIKFSNFSVVAAWLAKRCY